MYAVSNRLKILQLIYDYHLIAVWYESLLAPQETLEPAPSQPADSEIDDNRLDEIFSDLVTILRDECNTSRSEVRFLIWKTKNRIRQDVLFALVRKFIRDNSADLLECEAVHFCAEWCLKRSSIYVDVETSCDSILSFYKQLFVKCQCYQNSVMLRLEITRKKKRKTADISVIFDGGLHNPLALNGNYKYETGKLSARVND